MKIKKKKINSENKNEWVLFKKRAKIVPIILIIILGSVIYSNSLNGAFIWDDDTLVKENLYIRNWSNIGKFFAGNISTDKSPGFKFYRPFQMITYAIDYSLWKLNVKGYHLTNILLHISVALLLYWLVNILYGDRLFSLLTSIFFVTHPIHTEAIAYISGRSDPLSAFFMLLCFIFYVKILRRERMGFFIFL